jgi:hypothetical protein
VHAVQGDALLHAALGMLKLTSPGCKDIRVMDTDFDGGGDYAEEPLGIPPRYHVMRKPPRTVCVVAGLLSEAW